MPTLEQTIYEISVNALRQQEQALIELRSRTGTLLTASSLIASFLGAQALARNGLTIWVICALAAFGTSAALSVYALLPKNGMAFALDSAEAYQALFESRRDENLVHYQLAHWMRAVRMRNHPTVKHVTRAFELAALAVLAEIGFLALSLLVT